MAQTQHKIPCSSCSDNATAISWCVECGELVCGNCVDAHRRLKVTRNHTIKTIQQAAVTDIKCKNCADNASAVSWCVECSEFICGECVSAHQRVNMTKSHTIITKKNLSTVVEVDDQNLSTVDARISMNLIDDCYILSDRSSREFGSLQTISVAECSQTTVNKNLEPNQISDQISNELRSHQTRNVTEHRQQTVNNNLELDQHTSNLRTDLQVVGTTDRPSRNASLSSWFNLTDVLNESSDGKAILKFYGKGSMILPKHRKKLNKLILEKTFSVKNELSIQEREEIAQQISLVFHTEQKQKYFDKKKGQKCQILTGSLQAAYNYRKSKLGKVKKRKRNNAEDIDDDDDVDDVDPSIYFSDDVEKSFRNMQQNSLNDDTAMIDWDNCFEFRKAKMSHYKTFDDVCKDWPFFCRLNGFSFIKYDFQKLFGSGNALLFGWCDFIEDNIRIITAMINNPRTINSLNQLGETEGMNEKCIIFCLALFHIPEIIQAAIGYGSKRWRPTIKSSKNSVLQRVYSKDSIAKAIRARSIVRDQKEIKDHPIIYAVGQYLDEMTDFYVALGDALFHFNSFIEALDASFKCYKVFRLDYPKESANFWKFINLVFYKAGSEKNSDSITELLNLLELRND